MSPQQVPHYFSCSKPFSLCMTACVNSFPCKMIQGTNNSGKVIHTWECDNGIPAIWFVTQEKAKYKVCIDECMQENKRCLIEKTLPIGEEWPLPEPEKVETKKDWKYKNLNKAGIKSYEKKYSTPKGKMELGKYETKLKLKAKKFQDQQKRRAKVAKIIYRLGLNPQ